MGVVTASSSAAQTTLGFSTKLSKYKSTLKRPLIVAFKDDKPNNTALVAPREQIPLPVETTKGKKRRGKTNNELSSSTLEMDYNEAAAKLENLYKLSPTTDNSDVDVNGLIGKGQRRKRKTGEGVKQSENRASKVIVKNPAKKTKRLSLDERIAMRKNTIEEVVTPIRRKTGAQNEDEKIDELVRDYSASTDLVSLDWKKMKIPPVLSSTEHAWLFKLMQPMKVNTDFIPMSLVLKIDHLPSCVRIGSFLLLSYVSFC